MPALSEDRIAELLQPYLSGPLDARPHEYGGAAERPIPPGLLGKLAAYLDLLISWNARTNLTAVRTPERVVERHFGESLFAGRVLAHFGELKTSMLDFGSGAGFPGIPIQLLHPEMQVTLAESQGKKAAFLREAVRLLELPATIWAGRVEDMPKDKRYDVVTMRAVDQMDCMRSFAMERVRHGGCVLEIGLRSADDQGLSFAVPGLEDGRILVSRLVKR